MSATGAYEKIMNELRKLKGTSADIADRLGLSRKDVAVYMYHMAHDDLKRIVVVAQEKGPKGSVPVYDLSSKQQETKHIRKVTFGNNR